MDLNTSILCDPCTYEQKDITADKWCTVCCEGLCSDCVRFHKKTKGFRDHELVSINEYHKIKLIAVNLNCKDHGKRFQSFCSVHDVPVCETCIIVTHAACRDVIEIASASKDVKKSSAVITLRETIEASKKTIDNCKKNRELAIENIDKNKEAERNSIQCFITEEKTKLKEYFKRVEYQLNCLENHLFDDLETKHSGCRCTLLKELEQLDSIENRLIQNEDRVKQIHGHGSELQIFVGVREITEIVGKQQEELQNSIQTMKNYTLSAELNSTLGKILDKKLVFGDITVREQPSKLKYLGPITGQIPLIRNPIAKNIHKVSLQFMSEITYGPTNAGNQLSGCAVASDGMIYLADFGIDILSEYNPDGSFSRNIARHVYSVICLDNESIVASFAAGRHFDVLNISSQNIETTSSFELGHNLCGIAFYKENFYVLDNGHKLYVANLSGKVVKRIKLDKINDIYNLVVDDNKLYYTVTKGSNSSLNCCDLNGQKIWSFQDESLRSAQGLAFDPHGNIFVVGKSSHKLLLVQSDGKDSQALLTESDGLHYPSTVSYNKEKNILCIGSEAGKARLYCLQ